MSKFQFTFICPYSLSFLVVIVFLFFFENCREKKSEGGNRTTNDWFCNPILRLIDQNAPTIIAILCQADQAMPPVKIHLNQTLFFCKNIYIFQSAIIHTNTTEDSQVFFKSKNIFITIYNFWKIYEKVLWKKFLFETNMITQVERKKGEKICIFLFSVFWNAASSYLKLVLPISLIHKYLIRRHPPPSYLCFTTGALADFILTSGLLPWFFP